MDTKTEAKEENITLYISIGALIISLLTYLGFLYDLSLKNRPYLYVESKWPVTWTYTDPATGTSGHRKIMVSITLNNKGPIPASIIKNDWYIAADNRRITDPSKFYIKEQGRDLLYQTVFPEQVIDLPKYKPDVSPTTNIVDLNFVVTYQGTSRLFFGLLGQYRTYWYSMKSRYKFEYLSNESISITQVSYETNWDRNENMHPPIAEPFSENANKIGESMTEKMLLHEVLIKNFNIAYVILIILISLLIRSIMSMFKAFAIKQGEADGELESEKFSKLWNWKQAFWRTFIGFGHHINIDDYWLTVLLGTIELFTYPVLMKLDKWPYIGAWIGIKTASTWGPWRKSRTAYTRFLIGNLMVIIASLFLAKFIVN